jgi:hypothetical protein
MAGAKRLVPILLGVAALVVLAVLLSNHERGVGHFDQRVFVKSTKAVKEIHWCDCSLDERTRLRAEQTADPRMFEFDSAVVGNGEFTATVKFTTSDGPLRRSRVYYRPHLVVFVEFVDGERTMRVVDIPPGLGRDPIVVEMN